MCHVVDIRVAVNAGRDVWLLYCYFPEKPLLDKSLAAARDETFGRLEVNFIQSLWSSMLDCLSRSRNSHS